MHHLHRAVLKRILLAWLAVSLLFLGCALVYGRRKLDAFAADMALASVNQALAPGNDAQPSGPATQSRLKQLIESRNVVLRFYDAQGRLSSQAIHPDSPHAEAALEPALAPLPRDGHPHFRRFEIVREPYVQWLLPLEGNVATGGGFIEGVMALDREALAVLKTSIQVHALTVLGSLAAMALALYPLMLTMSRRVFRFANELEKTHIEIVAVLGAAVSQRDSETSAHNFRVALYAIRLAEALDRKHVDMRTLIVGAFLHDVGKIGVRDSILLKQGRLTEEEFALMRSHVEHGVDIISRSRWLLPALRVVRAHHERYDGTGYPSELSGEEIPIEARIFSVVDVFDALTSHRPYKEAAPLESALEVVLEHSGTHFDPAVVSAFHPIAPELYREIHALSEAELMDRLIRTTDRYHSMFLEEEWRSALAGTTGSGVPTPA